MDSLSDQRILITGAQGNLGRKLISKLAGSSWCKEIIGIDRSIDGEPITAGRVRLIEADLSNPNDHRWRDAMHEVNAVVHFAAKNPYPDASWDDACASFDMTAHVVETAAEAGVQRLVFASSNHVMGGYKDPPLAKDLHPSHLSTALPPSPGTRWFNGREFVQGTAYATSKLLGERLCSSKAHLSMGKLTAVSVRIGWCQPGENRPETISATGLPGDNENGHPAAERDLRWFRQMWLSNRDFDHLMERALLADSSAWPSVGIVVNGMSANQGMAWDIETTRRLLGFAPEDNIWDHVSE